MSPVGTVVHYQVSSYDDVAAWIAALLFASFVLSASWHFYDKGDNWWHPAILNILIALVFGVIAVLCFLVHYGRVTGETTLILCFAMLGGVVLTTCVAFTWVRHQNAFEAHKSLVVLAVVTLVLAFIALAANFWLYSSFAATYVDLTVNVDVAYLWVFAGTVVCAFAAGFLGIGVVRSRKPIPSGMKSGAGGGRRSNQ